MSNPSTKHLNSHALFIAITVFLFLFLVLLPTDGSSSSSTSSNNNKKRSSEKKKLVLGSRPPSCVNKCLSCRPCMAALVIPPGKHSWQKKKKNLRVFSHDENNNNGDSYYLLSWKCKCGDKIFQP